MEKAIDSFVQYQREAEERFKTRDEERWRRETEMEERRKQDKQEHEMRMMRMLRDMFQGNDYNSYPRQYDYNNY